MKTLQIKTLFGKVLFEYEKENNTVKDTLINAVYSGAYLRGADLRGADLTGADLKKEDILKRSIIPQSGSFIAYKSLKGRVIAKIEIPAKAKRVSPVIGRKCRASYVKVLEITKGKEKLKECGGWRDEYFIYKVGRIARADKFDPNPFIECSNGIHFFVTKEEALEWN